jgi:quercetin dioxygenase-like cupin family protein
VDRAGVALAPDHHRGRGFRELQLQRGDFSQGCTTGWHAHTCDQILVVTSGSGMVATEHEQQEINVGDVVHIKAGERHWHGAKANTTMGHITITAVGGQAKWG